MTMAQRLHEVTERIERAKLAAGRTDNISLMAVSKTHPIEAVEEAVACGQLLFGENRVQEIQQKFSGEARTYEVHLIGHLQSNKVRKAVSLVDAIDSVDSPKLLRLVDSEAARIGKVLPVLLEWNTSKERAKSGFTDEREYFETLEEACAMRSVRIEGLMTIGPLSDDERQVRAAFARLRELAIESSRRFPELDFSTLSMGMSQDFPWAILEGSTVVRVGTAIFGTREYR